MNTEDRLRTLASVFSLPPQERAAYFSITKKSAALIYDEDGSSTDNVLFFLCVNYLDIIDTCHGTEDVGEETFYRELKAVLNVFFNLPAHSDYVWDYSKTSYDGGVFDDLWFIVARLSRVIIAHHCWKPEAPTIDVNLLVEELLA